VTTILAVRHNNTSFIASDSRLVEGDTIYEGTGKLFMTAPDVYVGVAGSMSVVGELLRGVKLSDYHASSTEMSDYRKVWALGKALEGAAHEDTGLVVATKHGIYAIDFDKTEEGFRAETSQMNGECAAGSGSDAVRGAWHALMGQHQSEPTPDDIKRMMADAIRIASKIDSQTGGRVYLVVVGEV
jgi:ATP-dependent protease HslVU (ClpYQ) peptidase subunit